MGSVSQERQELLFIVLCSTVFQGLFSAGRAGGSVLWCIYFRVLRTGQRARAELQAALSPVAEVFSGHTLYEVVQMRFYVQHAL